VCAPTPWTTVALATALALAALWEFYGAVRLSGGAPLEAFGFGAVVLLMLATTPALDPPAPPYLAGADPFPGPRSALLFQTGFTLLLTLSLALELARGDRAPLRNLAPTWLGALYLGWLFTYPVRLRITGASLLRQADLLPERSPGGLAVDAGALLLLFLLLLTWSADSFAYLVGRRWGRRRMAPILSPAKTWEGLVGGWLATVAIAGVVGTMGFGYPLGWALVAGVVVGGVAPVGDLVKSSFKREVGIKDFGSLFPGHGGVLDRCDSLLLTAPALYFCLLLWPR